MNTASNSSPLEISLPFPSAFWGRVLYGLFITVMPIFSFSMVHVMKPEWQSGRLSDYAILFLFPEASLFLLPLLSSSIICYLLLLIDPVRFAPKVPVRFGVYTGVLLALHYSIAILLSFEPSAWFFPLAIAWISPILFFHLYPWAVKKWNVKLLGRVFASLLAVLALIGMVVSRNIFSPFFTALILLVIVAPFWSFLLSARTAIWLIKNHESKITVLRGMSVGLWVAAYIGALRFNILKMYELYAALPPQPPNCYIATAAAQGHPRIVGSQPVRLGSGNLIHVNPQIQHLKSVELALMAISPALHKLIRRVYDVVGKKLAVHIQKPLLADVAFLLLLPVEWISLMILKLIVPEVDTISRKLYRS